MERKELGIERAVYGRIPDPEVEEQT